MSEKYHQSDYKAMGAIAHKIKPSIDNMGIISLKETIREIERIGKTGAASDSLTELLEKVSNHLDQVVKALQNEFETITS